MIVLIRGCLLPRAAVTSEKAKPPCVMFGATAALYNVFHCITGEFTNVYFILLFVCFCRTVRCVVKCSLTSRDVGQYQVK